MSTLQQSNHIINFTSWSNDLILKEPTMIVPPKTRSARVVIKPPLPLSFSWPRFSLPSHLPWEMQHLIWVFDSNLPLWEHVMCNQQHNRQKNRFSLLTCLNLSKWFNFTGTQIPHLLNEDHVYNAEQRWGCSKVTGQVQNLRPCTYQGLSLAHLFIQEGLLWCLVLLLP